MLKMMLLLVSTFMPWTMDRNMVNFPSLSVCANSKAFFLFSRLSLLLGGEQAVLNKTTFGKDGRMTVKMLWKGEFSCVPPSKVGLKAQVDSSIGDLSQLKTFIYFVGSSS
jgi:hypothetical protein